MCQTSSKWQTIDLNFTEGRACWQLGLSKMRPQAAETTPAHLKTSLITLVSRRPGQPSTRHLAAERTLR